MQSCLETVADAVLQVVMFQVEADENDSYLVDPDASPIVQGVAVLIDLAKQKAALWSETDQPHNQAKMLEYCKELHAVTMEIAHELERLKTDAYDQASKDNLLFACRNSMVITVHLMKLADQYDITHVTKACKLVKTEQQKLMQSTMKTLNENVQSYIYSAVTLAKEVYGRAEYIVDTAMKEKLLAGNSCLQKDPEQLIKLTVYLMQNPSDGLARDQQEEIAMKIVNCAELMMELAIQSSEQLFQGILLDLDPITRDKLVNRILPAPASCDSVLAQMIEHTGKMAHSILSGAQTPELLKQLLEDAKYLKSRYLQVKDLTENEIAKEESGHRKGQLSSCLGGVEEGMRTVISSLVDANSTNEIDGLMNALAKLKSACEKLQKALAGEDDYDLLDGSVNRLQQALLQLKSAVDRGDKEQLIAATKEAVQDIKAEGCSEISSDQLVKLVEGTKAALLSGDASSLASLASTVASCQLSVQQVSSISNRPEWRWIGALDQLQTAAALLADAENQKVQQGLRQQESALKAVNNQADSLSQLSAKLKSSLMPRLQRLNSFHVKLRAAAEQNDSVESRRELEKEALTATLELLRAVSDDPTLASATDLLVDSVQLTVQSLNKLQDVIRDNDKGLLDATLGAAETRLSQQELIVDWIRHPEYHPDVPSTVQQQLAQANTRLKTYHKALPAVTRTAAANPSKQEEFNVAIHDIKDGSQQVLTIAMDASELAAKVADYNVELETEADNVQYYLSAPSSQQLPDLQSSLQNIVDQFAKQRLVAGAQVSLVPAQQSVIEKPLHNADTSLNKLRSAIADHSETPNMLTKNSLKKALAEAAVQSEALTEAVQVSPFDRIRANGRKFQQQCELIASPETDPYFVTQIATDRKALKRYDKQMALAKQVTDRCTHAQMKLATRKLTGLGLQLGQRCRQAVDQEQDVSQVIAPAYDKLRQVNEKFMTIAERMQQEEQAKPIGDDTTLDGAASRIVNASENLLIDGSPKGQLYSLIKQIGLEMQKMAQAATEENKRAIISSARSISTLSNNIVKIAGLLVQQHSDKTVCNEMMSMAAAAKNFSVQLKILAAVKTASSENDPTTETQLVTCAKGLANSIIQTINCAEVLELKSAAII